MSRALGGARRRREDSCGAWAALQRAGQPFAGAKGRWQRFAEAVGSSPDARWGRPLGGVRMGPSGVVATATRRKGPGGVCWKRRFSGLPTFGARRGLVGRGEVRGVSSACEPGAKAGPPYFTICCSRRPGAQLIRCKSPNFRPALRSSTCHRSSLLAPAFRRRGASRDSLGPQKQTSRSSRALTLAGSAQRMFARWHPSQA